MSELEKTELARLLSKWEPKSFGDLIDLTSRAFPGSVIDEDDDGQLVIYINKRLNNDDTIEDFS